MFRGQRMRPAAGKSSTSILNVVTSHNQPAVLSLAAAMISGDTLEPAHIGDFLSSESRLGADGRATVQQVL
ncbi:hypothetical protein EVAR_95693_1 [Eumeta japonica]|uniref:Uncharacterized protein n=1 Tax=Eumeta variegata TaxID=151549 RepID=A0A4C1VK21_EUMVA|nr:hypothetical protein EVAR_95693_1 [Eumeta japonica]